MFFSNDHRDAVAAELGSGATAQVAKVLGEKWAQTTDRHVWERQAEQDRIRHDREMVAYNDALEVEAEEEARARQAAASGPSEREVERDAKRARASSSASTSRASL